jgi:DNA-binding transcriptional LysR family regulator
MSEDRQIRRLKLRELRILMAVIQAESMAKAARQLAISQPAVSRAIADMEHTLEVPLFDRTARGIEPTRYGRALFRRSVAVFDELKQGVQEIAYLSNPEAGELRIGSSASLSEGIVLAVVNRLSRKYPQVVFHVVPGGALALRESLRERRIELGIARLPEAAAEDEVHAEILFEEPLVVVASTANPWVRRRRIKLAAVIPASPLKFHAEHASIKKLPIELPMTQRSVGIITLKKRTLSPLAQLFIECAREVAKPLSRRP